jgi:adenosylmethionine-8-amino-7-oxononanoate aminotransferase
MTTAGEAPDLVWMPSVRGGRFRPGHHVIVASAKAFHVSDHAGHRYLDLNSGLWHISFGYDHPVLTAAAHAAIDEVAATSMFRRLHQPAVGLAARLTERFADHRFFFGCSGSDAADTAMRIASMYRQATGRKGDLFGTVAGAYHGVTYAGRSLLGIESYRGGDTGVVQRIVLPRVEEGTAGSWVTELDHLFATSGHRLTAVFVEVVQGSGGIIPLVADYLRAIRKRCDVYDALLVVDEVATGLHRTGPFLASHVVDIRGDITILGKALTGGFGPLSVVAVQDRVFEAVNADPRLSRLGGFTQGGHPIGCRVAEAVLEYVDRPEFLDVVHTGAIHLAKLLGGLRDHPVVDRITGRGHMWGIQIRAEDVARLGGPDAFIDRASRAAMDHGALIHPLASGTIPVMPALVAPAEVLSDMVARLAAALDSLARA